ncbi:membrane-spanning 4-domains subfamily A member 3 isoform X4 [Saimiri boliviensis]|uniref:membrane-spanning 4-domains subfamily A member 3 isoform X4 n=1 Tax=Saimiri boliviensis TaxID=27679 RepID=UPI003D77A883
MDRIESFYNTQNCGSYWEKGKHKAFGFFFYHSHKQHQMASHEVEDAELGSASAHGIPGIEPGPDGVNNSVYQPTDGSQDYQKGELQFLGAIHILNAAMILALGVFLGSLPYLFYFNRHFFFFTFYTGYPIWGAVFFCISGTLSVVAGRKPTRTRRQDLAMLAMLPRLISKSWTQAILLPQPLKRLKLKA